MLALVQIGGGGQALCAAQTSPRISVYRGNFACIDVLFTLKKKEENMASNNPLARYKGAMIDNLYSLGVAKNRYMLFQITLCKYYKKYL